MLLDFLIEKTRDVRTPDFGTKQSAGLDFYVPNDFNDGKKYLLGFGESVNIPSGIIVKMPQGFCLIAYNKSGVALQGLSVGGCVVDADYQGEIHLHVFNREKQSVYISPGQKLVQFILTSVLTSSINIQPVFSAWADEKTERGKGGFGSTDIKTDCGNQKI